MDYRPLNVAKNEIRILKLPPKFQNEYATSTELATLNLPPLTLKNVSLNDISQDFKTYAAENGPGTPSSGDYYRWVDKRRMNAGLASMKNLFAAEDLDVNPVCGRWEWGDFTAISYMWGETSNEREIVINGCPFRVRENLYSILRDLWLDPQSTTHEIFSNIWVDAICINQNDMTERNIQVMRMGDIYRQAIAVVGWIGSPSLNLDKAASFIKTLANLWKEHLKRSQGDGGVSFIFVLGQSTLEEVQLFFGLPYWNRLWIVQEIATSLEHLTFSGPCALQHIDLLCACLFLQQHDHFLTKLLQTYEQANMRIENFVDQLQRIGDLMTLHPTSRGCASNRSLAQLSRISRLSQQTDDRDKIYGMLNLMDPDLADSIIPDYSKSVPQVFTDFAKSVITHTNSLDYICSNRACLQDQADIPSWVPDLREPLQTRIRIEIEGSYHASGERGADARFDIKNDFLMVKGFQFDVVDGLSVGFDGDKPIVNGDRKVVPTKGCSNAYASEEMARDALWRTMIAEPDQSEGLPSTLESLRYIPWDLASSELGNISGDSLSLQTFHHLRLMNSHLSIGGISLKKYYTQRLDFKQDVLPIVLSETFQRVISIAFGRKLAITDKGRFALLPSLAERGDVICILFGCSVPVVLRYAGKCWKLVGECYLDGIMRGEALKLFEGGECREEEFIIS